MDLYVTKMSRSIMPAMTNRNSTLFGGKLLSWMDEIAGITAARYANSKVATVAIETVLFMKPICGGDFIDVEGRILSVGKTSLRVMIEVSVDKGNGRRENAAEAVFVYVALDESGKPKKVVEEI
ncbi:acyl-CoA thioesterase [Anaerobium acetethylicum]|uniref:Acyl-CoA thioesterase YciA n=1 Tax=Anaerobium acetethylicum TaxID=1619234 RepID=A0A1D3TVH6_9FIRM|nr:hotdog domain-containing protein [Anaerobium acetethylicum]SCP98151.1 acyl-CoA thioesterase YciA [Anaerobium acetethylicum]